MLRQTPLKRTGWQRKPASKAEQDHAPAIVEQAQAAIKNVAPLRRGTYAGSTTQSAPKTEARKNQALLKLARGRPCLLLVPGVCCMNPDTTVACHSNLSQHGKAGARKADDCYSVWGCVACHSWLDQGRAPGDQKRSAFMLALQRQVTEWRRIADALDAKPRERNAALWALDQLLLDGVISADQ